MDTKRWVVTAVVVTVAVTVLEYLFNSYVLVTQYAATASLWRPVVEMNRLMPYGWVATLIMAFLLVYIYHRGYQGKGSGIGEGLRFGLIIGLFMSIPMTIWTYVMIPITTAIAVGWFVMSVVDYLVAGVIIGALYRRTTA